MNINTVINRKKYKGLTPINNGYQLLSYIESADISNSTKEIENIIKNWNRFSADKDFSFNECMTHVKNYIVNNPNSKQNIPLIEESIKDALYYISDINRANNSIKDYFKDYPELKNSLLEFTNDISISDRILNNDEKLLRIKFNDIFEESTTNEENLIEEACELIDTKLKVSQSIKYNLCLENCLYQLYKNGKNINPKSIFETVTNYFCLKDIDDKNIEPLQNVFEQSPLYKDIDKSNVLYVMEMSRKDLSDSDFGIPEEKKYPMPDAKHVLSAIKFFNYVSPEYEKELANHIKNKIKKFGLKDIHVGDNNRFKKYYKGSKKVAIKESTAKHKAKCPFCECNMEYGILESHIKKAHSEACHKYPHFIKSYLNDASPKVSASDQSLDYDSEDSTVGLLETAVNEIAKLKKNPIKNILNSAKADKKKDKAWGTKLINKIFTQSPESIIEEIPDFLGLIRRIMCLSMLAVPGWGGLGLTLIGLFTNRITEMKVRKPVMDKAIKSYKKEKEKVDNKLYSTTNEKKKKRLKDLSKKLDDDIFRLEQAEEKLYSEKEMDKKREAEWNESENDQELIGLKDFFKFYKVDFTDKLFFTAQQLQEFVKNDPEFSKYIEKGIFNMVDPEELRRFELATMNSSDALYKYIEGEYIQIKIAYVLPLLLSNHSMLYPKENIEVLDKMNSICDFVNKKLKIKGFNLYTLYIDGTDDLYYFVFKFNRPIYYSNDNINRLEYNYTISQINAIDNLDESLTGIYDGKKIKLVNETFYDAINEDTIDSILNILKETTDILDKDKIKEGLNKYLESNTNTDYSNAMIKNKIRSFIENFDNIQYENEYRNVILTSNRYKDINEAFDSLLELSIGSKAKLSVNKVKNTAKKLNDKQRNLSKTLDNSLEKVDDELRRNMSNNAREKIIKGRVLPKASKLIKLGIGTATLAAIQPALAAIAVLGGIGISKVGSKKEKQFILDEIDIQLKLVEKKIQLAENNNDMKSLEELFKIEKKLKRERQRIFYNMKAYYPVSAN